MTTSATEHDDPREGMTAALREIRHEGWKAAVIYATIDAVAAALAVNLALTLLEPSWLPASWELGVTVPTEVAETLEISKAVSVPGGALVGLGLGVAVLFGEVAWRVRQPLVEQFEAGNPEVAESLRTARDAVESGADSEMARRLYADVLERLQETSSIALVDLRRVTITVVLVVALSAASVQATVQEVTLSGADDEPEVEGPAGNESVEFSGLEDGNSVLGEESAVESGEENETARIESTGGDEDIEDSQSFPGDVGSGGGGTDGTVESQQAGFERQEELEDAELVREYSVRIRQEE
jgi:hypothetical protein